jgi:hypothetical protein
MDFDLQELLKALGSNAALIFAAWIFLSFLQQRYSGAYDRYRQLIDDYRNGERDSPHSREVHRQILLYRQRCEQMRLATQLGVWAAISIIVGLLAGAISMMVGENPVLKVIGAGGVMLGLAVVVAAALLVVRENSLIERALESEPADIPELTRVMSRPQGRRKGHEPSVV